jgi:hypothetical protein
MADFIKNNDDVLEEDDVLTVEEQKQIEILKVTNRKNNEASEKKVDIIPDISAISAISAIGAIGAINSRLIAGALAGGIATNTPPAEFSIGRRLGFCPVVTITNISDKKAWVILSPAPITSVSSVGLEKVGQVGFSSVGDYKCQQCAISSNNSREFDLDNSQIYYSVFFDCGAKWKTPFKNRKINTRKYDINLLQRHIDDAIDSDFVPNN